MISESVLDLTRLTTWPVIRPVLMLIMFIKFAELEATAAASVNINSSTCKSNSCFGWIEDFTPNFLQPHRVGIWCCEGASVLISCRKTPHIWHTEPVFLSAGGSGEDVRDWGLCDQLSAHHGDETVRGHVQAALLQGNSTRLHLSVCYFYTLLIYHSV